MRSGRIRYQGACIKSTPWTPHRSAEFSRLGLVWSSLILRQPGRVLEHCRYTQLGVLLVRRGCLAYLDLPVDAVRTSVEIAEGEVDHTSHRHRYSHRYRCATSLGVWRDDFSRVTHSLSADQLGAGARRRCVTAIQNKWDNANEQRVKDLPRSATSTGYAT